uniref:Uncharacterized protein n=1 Tax=Arundo donax TaxID=35708 RepID=A0A0A9HQ01_ARUDO
MVADLLLELISALLMHLREFCKGKAV